MPSATRRLVYISAKTSPGVFTRSTFAIKLRIVQMGAMRMPMLAETSISQNYLMVLISSHVIMTVAYYGQWPVALRLNPCVTTEETWTNPFVKVSVTYSTPELRIHIGGLAMEPKSVFSRRLDVTGFQIARMPLN